MDKNEVSEAFEILVEEIEEVANSLNEEGAQAFRRPILEALVELGGGAAIGEVLARVDAKMKDVFNEYDQQPLHSDPRSVRWKNTAQWCRNSLVREGLMKSDSPHGVWEISSQGRRWQEKKSLSDAEEK